MKIFPAIDLMEGRAVRLVRGRRENAVIYSETPWQLCAEFAAQGAERIHVVDLDGAFSGRRVQTHVVERLLAASSVPLQVGGGLRDRAALDAVFNAGAAFAVIGTAALATPQWVERACAEYPGRVIVAVDAVGGKVAIAGWSEHTHVDAVDLARQAHRWGAAAILYTDIERDGTGTGPAVQATATLARAIELPVIASGGIGSLEHIRALAAAHIEMAVVGRAIYDQCFTVAEAIAAAMEPARC
jgi:phosphoribosylformimino-5-aminoimidazole carboxamide ribotide isomerase